MPARSSSSFRLAANSRRRRRLLLLQQQDEPHGAREATPERAALLPTEISTVGVLDRSLHGVALVRDMLEDAAPRTWLFTGDTLGFDARKSKRGWVEFFSDKIKVDLQRRLDVVLDTSVRDSLVSTLRRNVDWRILRFQPDVVFLMPGPRESIAGEAGMKRFEVDLRKLVERLEEEGTVVGLCTPPSVPGPDDEYRDLAGYVRLIVQVASETDAILIDHWQNWSQLESPASLLDHKQQQPNFTGHQKLARHLLATIGIGDL